MIIWKRSLQTVKKNKIFSLLGLATRSRNVVSGEFMTEKAVKSYSAELVIVGEDASDNTKKMFTNMCEFYEVPMFIYGTKDELGHAMGKEMRASLAITDENLANAVENKLKACKTE